MLRNVSKKGWDPKNEDTLGTSSPLSSWLCRLLYGRSSSLNRSSRAVQRRSRGRQGRVQQRFVGQGAGSVPPHRGFYSSFLILEHAVQCLHVAGAFNRQLIGHGALRGSGEGFSSLTDVLSFTLQVLVQHVAAEGWEVLLWGFRSKDTLINHWGTMKQTVN